SHPSAGNPACGPGWPASSSIVAGKHRGREPGIGTCQGRLRSGSPPNPPASRRVSICEVLSRLSRMASAKSGSCTTPRGSLTRKSPPCCGSIVELQKASSAVRDRPFEPDSRRTQEWQGAERDHHDGKP